MKKIAVLFAAFSFLILISRAYSCSMMAPFLNLADGEETCVLEYYQSPEFSVNRSNIGELCQNISLTEQDKDIVFGFAEELKPNYGYTSIERQSEEEYSNFLETTDSTNSDDCDCQNITIHGRNGNWTAYTNGFKNTCSFSTACYQPPAFCLGSGNGYASNGLDFMPLLGIPIIILMIFLITRRRK